MLETEFIKSLQNNYERLHLAERPEEKRYQYCILSRGGIAGLLPCSLRYINGEAYLYYDITSKQTVTRCFRKKPIDRAWIKDFAWNLRRIRAELERFLLDEHNLIWFPEQVFQNLGDNVMSFLYVPYHKEENGFLQMLEFLVEKVDYQDSKLVEVVYRIYEQYEQNGDVYLQSQIYEDIGALDRAEPSAEKTAASVRSFEPEESGEPPADWETGEVSGAARRGRERSRRRLEAPGEGAPQNSGKEPAPSGKRGIRSFFESARKRERAQREAYQRENKALTDGYFGEYGEELSAVAEESTYGSAPGRGSYRAASDSYEQDSYERDSYERDVYERDSGFDACEEDDEPRTVYLETIAEQKDETRRLYSAGGKVLATLGKEDLAVGKDAENVDLVLEDISVSRLHARIFLEDGEYYIEDLNSTNGTFKNGLRMEPYERRMLRSEDEIQIGSVKLVFR